MTRALPPVCAVRDSPPKYVVDAELRAVEPEEEAGTDLKNCSVHFERAAVVAPSPTSAMFDLV